MKELRALAFYLPQYHPIPENDLWWGTGFTDWTNVTKASPLFRGHDQPRSPADLGFYDLRVPEVRIRQAELAREHGIYGFCYYHYWFHGRQVLERPFNEVLSSGQPDFPFCLCWANENWTRIWDGMHNQVLLRQNYSEEDDRQHIRWLADAFRDPRYIRVDDKPVILIYRASDLPNPARTSEIWREECWKLGVGDIYLCRVESIPTEVGSPQKIGFDASVEFQPTWFRLGTPLRRNFLWRILRRFNLSNSAFGRHRLFEYSSVVQHLLKCPKPSYKRFPCVTPGWDNSPRRRENAMILLNSNPAIYQKWLKEIVDQFEPFSTEENFIFINAWNEWAEGNHLEPCQKWERSYLEATREALSDACFVNLELGEGVRN